MRISNEFPGWCEATFESPCPQASWRGIVVLLPCQPFFNRNVGMCIQGPLERCHTLDLSQAAAHHRPAPPSPVRSFRMFCASASACLGWDAGAPRGWLHSTCWSRMVQLTFAMCQGSVPMSEPRCHVGDRAASHCADSGCWDPSCETARVQAGALFMRPPGGYLLGIGGLVLCQLYGHFQFRIHGDQIRHPLLTHASQA